MAFSSLLALRWRIATWLAICLLALPVSATGGDLMPQPDSPREAAMFIWEGLMKTPYRWGGDDAIEGYDCSGFVLAGLHGVGVLPRSQDFTADALLKSVLPAKPRFKEGKQLRRGMLVFWGAPKAHHVEVVWATFGDTVLTIGASGGGSQTTTLDAAAKQNAAVQVKPITPGWVAAYDPFSTAP